MVSSKLQDLPERFDAIAASDRVSLAIADVIVCRDENLRRVGEVELPTSCVIFSP